VKDLALPLDSAHRVAKRSSLKRQDLHGSSFSYSTTTRLLSLQLQHLLLLWQILAIADPGLLVDPLKFGWN